jgi:DNA mismatch repair protein MutS
MDGSSSHSYGIQVARLAGVPARVIQRAGEILKNLESGQWNDMGQPRLALSGEGTPRPKEVVQPDLFPATDQVREEVLRMNLSEMTPLEALNKLQEIQNRFKKEKGSH